MKKLSISFLKKRRFYYRLHSKKAIVFLSLCICISGCIEEFTPTLHENESLLVIDGSIIKENEIQRIIISKSTQINNPEFNPVQSCIVSVKDNHGNEFEFNETKPGIYEARIPEEYLVYGSSFQLNLITSGNEFYRSKFDTLLPSSPIDSVYFKTGTYQNSANHYKKGLQFYTDLVAPEAATKYYRWKLTETYEYNSNHIIEGYWDSITNGIVGYNSPDLSLYTCWREADVSTNYTASTENLTTNTKKNIPLNYVSRISEKLNVRYSLFLKQYSLTEQAYRYWDKKRVESQESGGLYQSQPSRSESNVYNVNKPNELVLGFFWASSYSKKRIFFKGPLGNPYSSMSCYLEDIDEDAVLKLTEWGFKKYLKVTEYGFVNIYGFAQSEECFDCRLKGGTTEKPDYWE